MSSPDTFAAAGAAGPRLADAPARSIESVLKNRWARWFIPSFSDLFFLAVGAWLFVSGGTLGWQGLLADGDAGWHIRTGEYILDHHAVPHQDLYSFSKPDQPWYAWEWLSDLILGEMHRVAGLKGVVLMAAVVIAVFSTTLVRRMMRLGAHTMVAMIVTLLGVGASSIHFLARPHVFTLLLLSVSMWVIEDDRERTLASPEGVGSRRIWWMAPLTLVWTNLHGGFLALIAVLGLTAGGWAVENVLAGQWRVRKSWNHTARYAGLTAACAAVTLINPYGWRLHQHMVAYLQSSWIREMVQEFQAPTFRTENMMQFEALLLVGLMVALALLQKRRVVEAAWIVFWGHMALTSARHVPVFITVAAPSIAVQVSKWWAGWSGRAKKSSLAGILNQIAGDSAAGFLRTSVWPALAVLVLALPGRLVQWPQDFPDLVFPTKIVHDHAALFAGARVLSTDQWGDYLIYSDPCRNSQAGCTPRKVFVDGRSDFYGREVGNEYVWLINGRWDWQQIMNQYRFNVALVATDTAISQLLKQSGQWRVLEDDGKRILLIQEGTSVPPQGNFHPEPRF